MALSSAAGPHPPVNQGRTLTLVSSFGLDQTTLGPNFPAQQIVNSQRVRELTFRENYFTCRQHDWKVFDWNGAVRRPEGHMTQPLIGEMLPDFYVPLNSRRPCSPYRLARSIVWAFTTLTFGYGRWPSFRSDDTETQDFAKALVKATRLKTKMIRARNLGGASGTVGLSWGYNNGKPRVRVHLARHLYVQEWEDEDELIPAHVIEIYQFPKDVWLPDKKRMERQFFWHRRDWTKTADIEFVQQKVEKDNPSWQIDEEKSVIHNDDECHFVWVQNLPDDDTTTIDGQPDYAETYEQLDELDIINSVSSKGTKLNLDPTLVLKMDQDEVGDTTIRKGSGNALVVGPSGDARYMELSGASVTAGHATIDKQREQVLEANQCILPDPNEVVGSATSSVALKIVYAPMLAKADIMRDQYGQAIERLLEGMIRTARKLNVGNVLLEQDIDPETGEPILDDDGVPVEREIQYTLNLKPKRVKTPRLDEEGNETGEFDIEEVPYTPGSGDLSLEWPDYFKRTSDDNQKESGSLTQATGGKPVMSHQTAVEQMATSMQRDPQEEWNRLKQEQEEQRKRESEMFPGMGGQVGSLEELPDDAELMEGESTNERPSGSPQERPKPSSETGP